MLVAFDFLLFRRVFSCLGEGDSSLSFDSFETKAMSVVNRSTQV